MPLDHHTIEATVRGDLIGFKEIIDDTGLFDSILLDEMIAPFLNGADVLDRWLTARGDDKPLGLAYYAPEPMTEGTWNLLLIAVAPTSQKLGIGSALVRRVERELAESGVRILLVETSGLPAFEKTRAFYRGIGFDEEARIRDFYQAGEDKVVFRKVLAAT